MIELPKVWGVPVSLALLSCLALPARAADPQVINLWPGKPPGEVQTLPPEENVTKPDDKPVGDRPIIKLTNVSTPTLSVYRPAKDRDTRAAVVVCPGGGHRILAFDHEGTEVAQWLNTIGVTGVVLKYRVPARSPDKRWEAAVQDSQRAMSVVRSKAQDWDLDARRIGILGFSAGGETAALTAILHAQRQYSPLDEVDQVSPRPDFAALDLPRRADAAGQSLAVARTRAGRFQHAADVLRSLLGRPRSRFQQPAGLRGVEESFRAGRIAPLRHRRPRLGHPQHGPSLQLVAAALRRMAPQPGLACRGEQATALNRSA